VEAAGGRAASLQPEPALFDFGEEVDAATSARRFASPSVVDHGSLSPAVSAMR